MAPLAAKPNRLTQRWTERLEVIDARLVAGEFARAEKDLVELQADVLDRMVDGPGEARLFGTLMVLRAVARAGQEDRDAAEWWWWSAQQAWPEAAAFELERFGDMGLALRDLGAPRARPATDENADAAGIAVLPDGRRVPLGRVVPPKLVRKVPPDYPDAKRRANGEPEPSEVVVQAVINTEGRLTRPNILAGMEAPGFALAALDAASQWTYEPALLDGQPQAVFLTLRILYSSRGGRSPSSAGKAPPTDVPGDASAKPVHIRPNMTPPRKLAGAQPTTPAGVHLGRVVVKAIVETTGRLTRLEVVESLNPIADKAVLRAVSDWRYAPAMLDGKPQAVYLRIIINFR